MHDLHAKRVVVTRPRKQYHDFAQALEAHGAEPVCFPVIEVAQVEDSTDLDAALRDLDQYDWLVLTSVNGVAAVWVRLVALGLFTIPPKVKVAAIGPKTGRALEARGVSPDFVPDEYIADAILPGLGEVEGKRILLARADIARKDLVNAIRKAGGTADDLVAYRTLPASPDLNGLAAIRAGVDVLTFTSSSTVHNFVAIMQSIGLDVHNLPCKPLFAYIGPITAETAGEYNLPIDVVAQQYTTDGLIDRLVDFYAQQESRS